MRIASVLSLLLSLLLLPAGRAGTLADSPPDAEARINELMKLIRRSNGVYSPLEAAAANNEKVLRARIADGADVNSAGEDGNTPLHLAARGKNPRLVKLLLDAGVAPEAKDSQGRTALEVCHHPKSRKLLEQAKLRRQKEIETDAMVKAGDAKGVSQAIKEGINPNAVAASGRGTLIITAIAAGQPEVLKVLMSHGAKWKGIPDQDGLSALHFAVRAPQKSAEIIAILLKAGADPMAKASNGVVALHDAAWFDNTEAIKALLPCYQDINFCPEGGGPGDYPINLALHHSGDDIVRTFLEGGLNPNDSRFSKEPLLVVAARNKRANCVRMLLEAGANKNARDEHGKTAADYATPEIAKLLR